MLPTPRDGFSPKTYACSRCGAPFIPKVPRGRKRRNGGPGAYYCAACCARASKEWRQTEKGVYWYSQKRSKEGKIKWDYVVRRKGAPCQDCGKTFPPPAMDFDHVRGEKTNSIAHMVSRHYSLKQIEAEVEKCDLVCANCHRVRTWNRSHPDEQY